MKTKLILIFLILISSLFIVGCEIFNNSQINDNLDNKYQSCPKNIIPNKVAVDEINIWTCQQSPDKHKIQTGLGDKKFNSTWADGTSIPSDGWIVNYHYTFSDMCHSGKDVGENVNFLYCNSLVYNKFVQEVDKEGNILKKENRVYSIHLVLQPLGQIVGGNWDWLDKIQGETWFGMPKDYWGTCYAQEVYMNYSIVYANCSINNPS